MLYPKFLYAHNIVISALCSVFLLLLFATTPLTAAVVSLDTSVSFTVDVLALAKVYEKVFPV